MVNKLIVFSLVGIFLISGVYASICWSNPSVGFPEPHTAPIKTDCPRAEVNQYFEDYRAGLISRKDMKNYVRSCEW